MGLWYKPSPGQAKGQGTEVREVALGFRILVKLRQDEVKPLAQGHRGSVAGELGLEPLAVWPRASVLNHCAVLEHERGDSTARALGS